MTFVSSVTHHRSIAQDFESAIECVARCRSLITQSPAGRAQLLSRLCRTTEPGPKHGVGTGALQPVPAECVGAGGSRSAMRSRRTLRPLSRDRVSDRNEPRRHSDENPQVVPARLLASCAMSRAGTLLGACDPRGSGARPASESVVTGRCLASLANHRPGALNS